MISFTALPVRSSGEPECCHASSAGRHWTGRPPAVVLFDSSDRRILMEAVSMAKPPLLAPAWLSGGNRTEPPVLMDGGTNICPSLKGGGGGGSAVVETLTWLVWCFGSWINAELRKQTPPPSWKDGVVPSPAPSHCGRPASEVRLGRRFGARSPLKGDDGWSCGADPDLSGDGGQMCSRLFAGTGRLMERLVFTGGAAVGTWVTGS